MMEPDLFTLLHFAFMGFIGAVLYVLIWAKNFQDLKTYEAFRTLVVGALVGYIYAFLHGNYNFPDSVMAVVAGYFGVDFVEAVMERLRKLLGF